MSAFEVIYYVCIRWYFMKKETGIIEIQRQVNDSVDNQGRHTHMGAMGPTHGRQRKRAPNGAFFLIFISIFIFFKSSLELLAYRRKFFKFSIQNR